MWQTLIDTADPDRPNEVRVRPAKEQFPLYGRSLALLRTIRPDDTAQPWTTTQVSLIRKSARQSSGLVSDEPR